MLITTKGIVFRFTKYRETSIIVNIYTEELGLNSFIVNGVRSAKSKHNAGYFEPLNLIEVTAYHRPNRDINRITEIKSSFPMHNIRQDIYKSAMGLFIAEVLNKCILERDKNLPLFNFLFNAIKELEQSPLNNSFHLQFMFKLSAYLGFGIHDTSSFILQSNNAPFYDKESNIMLLQQFIKSDFANAPSIASSDRKIILNEILHYYHLHMEMPKLKSLEILQTVFS